MKKAHKSGWKNESRRHSLARKGIKTNIESTLNPSKSRDSNTKLNPDKFYEDGSYKLSELSRQWALWRNKPNKTPYDFERELLWFRAVQQNQNKASYKKDLEQYEYPEKRGFYIVKSKKTGRVIETFDDRDSDAYSYPTRHGYENPEEFEVIKTGGY